MSLTKLSFREGVKLVAIQDYDEHIFTVDQKSIVGKVCNPTACQVITVARVSCPTRQARTILRSGCTGIIASKVIIGMNSERDRELTLIL